MPIQNLQSLTFASLLGLMWSGWVICLFSWQLGRFLVYRVQTYCYSYVAEWPDYEERDRSSLLELNWDHCPRLRVIPGEVAKTWLLWCRKIDFQWAIYIPWSWMLIVFWLKRTLRNNGMDSAFGGVADECEFESKNRATATESETWLHSSLRTIFLKSWSEFFILTDLVHLLVWLIDAIMCGHVRVLLCRLDDQNLCWTWLLN